MSPIFPGVLIVPMNNSDSVVISILQTEHALLVFGYCRFGVSPLTPLKGLFIQGPIFVSFFLAVSYNLLNNILLMIKWSSISLLMCSFWQINNMAEKVPSFKSGGAYWFIDLTTPDSFYIFPILTALTFLITVEVSYLLCEIIFLESFNIYSAGWKSWILRW